MPDVSPLPHGPAAALVALGDATARVAAATDNILRGEGAGRVWAALSEGLFWVAALDDQARAVAGYFARRDTDPGGRTVGGLVYARNMHAHELVTTAEVEFVVGTPTIVMTPPGEPAAQPGRGTIFAIRPRWAPFAALPPPGRSETHGRDLMYRDHVAERPLTEPLGVAAAWLATVFP